MQNTITSVFLPVALGVIMLGLGLSLTLDDFRRVLVYPKAVLVGLFCQMVILPFACYGVARAFGLSPELGVGLMLLAASPGGATANLYSHLAKGDVALNITLTATNSVLSLVTLPIIVSLSLDAFMGAERSIPLQFDKVIQVFLVVLGPVAIGMLIKAKRAKLSEKLQKPVKLLSAIFLVLVIVAAVYKERQNMLDYFKQVGVAALVFNLVSMAVGFFVPLLVRLTKRQATAIGMEIGIHNGTLAMYIASSPLLLNSSVMMIPPAIYSLIMLFTAAGFGFIVSRGNVGDSEEAAAGAPAEGVSRGDG